MFTGHHMDIYIPESFIESKIAVIEGPVVNTFGVLHCKVFDAKDKELTHDILNLPLVISLFVKDIKKEKHILVPEQETEPQPYTVLTYYKGDIVMPSSVPRDSGNVEMLFVKFIVTGKLNNVPYNRLLDIWERNFELNEIKLGVNATVLGVMLAEIYRDKSDPDKKFALTLDKNPKTSQYAYATSNIREICSRNSTFSALTFEDMDYMITSSLNMKNYKKKQVESPLEKIIKM